MKHPKFGAWMRNKYASDRNPIKFGIFVRVKRVRGRLNRGTWYQLTDGNGEFWDVEPEALELFDKEGE